MIAALQLTDIAVRFGGVQAVDGVSLVIEAGQFVGLIGPNGAGKTTLIRIVAGALRADRGRVLLGGTDITGHAYRVTHAQRPGVDASDGTTVPRDDGAR